MTPSVQQPSAGRASSSRHQRRRGVSLLVLVGLVGCTNPPPQEIDPHLLVAYINGENVVIARIDGTRVRLLRPHPSAPTDREVLLDPTLTSDQSSVAHVACSPVPEGSGLDQLASGGSCRVVLCKLGDSTCRPIFQGFADERIFSLDWEPGGGTRLAILTNRRLLLWEQEGLVELHEVPVPRRSRSYFSTWSPLTTDPYVRWKHDGSALLLYSPRPSIAGGWIGSYQRTTNQFQWLGTTDALWSPNAAAARGEPCRQSNDAQLEAEVVRSIHGDPGHVVYAPRFLPDLQTFYYRRATWGFNARQLVEGYYPPSGRVFAIARTAWRPYLYP